MFNLTILIISFILFYISMLIYFRFNVDKQINTIKLYNLLLSNHNFKEIELLIFFLIKNNLLENYINNVLKYEFNKLNYNKEKEHILFGVYRNCEPHLYIAEAFIWNKTSEGYLFWEDINELWLRFYTLAYINKKDLMLLIKNYYKI